MAFYDTFAGDETHGLLIHHAVGAVPLSSQGKVLYLSVLRQTHRSRAKARIAQTCRDRRPRRSNPYAMFFHKSSFVFSVSVRVFLDRSFPDRRGRRSLQFFVSPAAAVAFADKGAHGKKAPLCKGSWRRSRLRDCFFNFSRITIPPSFSCENATSLKVNCPKGKRGRPGPLHKGGLPLARFAVAVASAIIV